MHLVCIWNTENERRIAVNGKSFFKGIAASLLMSFLVCICFIPVKADTLDTQEVIVSSSAGKNGYYSHNLETGAVEYVPPPEQIQEELRPVPATDILLAQDDEPSPHIIVGEDNRQPVNNPSGRFLSTCLIRSEIGNKGYIGTGWLINDTYVMTAGHMLYKPNLGFADSIEVYVGASGGTYKEYRTGWWKAVGHDYVDSLDNEYNTKGVFDDWGIIELSTPLTVDVGHLGRHPVNSASDMQNRTYYTQGYPGDRNSDVTNWKNRVMYQTSGTIIGNRERYLPVVNTNIDVTNGQSGSAIYSYRSGYGYTAEGIVVAEYGSQDCNSIILYNTYLHNYVYDLIN